MNICEKYQDRIRSIGENLYAIDGKLFYFAPDVPDLSDEEIAGNLIRFTRELQDEDTILHGLCGRDDVCWLWFEEDGDQTITEGVSIDELPPEIREVAKQALAEPGLCQK